MAESDVLDGKYWYYTMIFAALDDPAPTPEIVKKFSELTCVESRVKCCADSLRMGSASLELTVEKIKSNEKAQEFRNSGNALFSSNGSPAKAAEMYTQSIAYALPGSRELALAYGNRSAVSFKMQKYEDCLLDIERSLENHYPDEMKAKLFARRVRCMVTLKKSQKEIKEALKDTRVALLKMDQNASGRDLVEKTLTDNNHMAPPLSTMKQHYRMKPTVKDDSCDIRGATGITIKYSKKYGRHLIATRDIRPGEIIAVIDNYAHGRSPDKCYHECAHCTNETNVGIPCDHCVNVIYCSTSCRDFKAWNDYHELECPILGILLELQFDEMAMLDIKVTLKALKEAGSVGKLKKMLKKIDSVSDPRVKGFTGNVFDCSKYACIYTLAGHIGKRDDQEGYLRAVISTFTVYYLATRTEIFGQKYDPDLKIFNKYPLIGFLGALMIKNFETIQLTLTGINGKDDVQVAPFTALCNHSCDSNVTCLGSNKSIAFALQPIKAGEQIWDNYEGLHYSRFPKAKRQKSLKDSYYFKCDCVPCVKNWPMLEKLPSALEMPGLSPATRKLLSESQKTFMTKFKQSVATRDFLAPKEELVRLIELLFKHACPCKEIMTYREMLKDMYGYGLNAS